MTIIDKFNYITSIQYKAWGAPMVGIFRSGNIWTIYFRNAKDEVLQEFFNFHYRSFEECVEDMYPRIKEWQESH